LEQKQDENKNESESDEEDEDEEDTDDLMESKNDEKTTIDLFKKIVDYLKPGETVLKAIKRLGSSSSNVSSSSSNLSASQRWLKKKQPQQTASSATIDSEKLKTDKQALETLTGYANQFIDQGFYDIYEETYEKIQLKLRNSAKQEADSFDIFADNVDENVLASSSGKSENITEGNLYLYNL
jgi:CD2 antigen cytoplasmic tail-binding protein 2